MFGRLAWSVSLFGAAMVQVGSVGARVPNEPAAAIRFDYVRGPGAEACPKREVVLDGLRSRLGHDPFADPVGGRLRCELAGSASGLRARVETWDSAGRSTGTRTLTSPPGDCSDLTTALLLVLTLASGPPGLAVAPPSAPSEGPAPAPGTATRTASAATISPSAAPPASRVAPPRDSAAFTPTNRVPPASPTEPAPARTPSAATPPRTATPPSDMAALGLTRTAPVAETPTRATPVSFLVGAGAIGTAGVLPRPSWGAVVTAGARWRVAALSLEGRYDAPASVTVEEGGRIRVWTASLAAVPCLHVGPLAGCAIAGAGIIRGAGVAVPAARTDVGPWALFGLRAAYHLSLGRTLVLKAHADLLAAPVETRMSLGESAVWATPLVSGAAGLTLLAVY